MDPGSAFGDLLAPLLAIFPRGEGLFFHHGKMFVYVVTYLIWVKTIAWVDRDSRTFSLPRANWNMTLIGCALAGLALVWLLPHFGAAFFLMAAAFLSPFCVYVAQRNAKVPDGLKVFTKNHMQKWMAKNLGIKMGGQASVAEEQFPVQFIGKMSGKDDNVDSRMARAAQSEGYRNAQELVWKALQTRATDIHMEPSREEMIVRYRIDGILQPAQTFDPKKGILLLNVYKNLAGMDIAERRKPQDGSFSAEIEEVRLVDFRVATSGSVHGEKLVMRILDSSKQMTSLEQVGMRLALRNKLEGVIQQSYGMLITCGPTGAGKTSTLYACMNQIDRHTRNVITLENPVEYVIENVTQIEVNPKAGKTFAAELRSILRQDPDVILIGEVRDMETAEIACQAAQTGHMVFTTLHANDTVTAVGRMIDLGVKPFLVASAVSAVLGQRLVRTLCTKCKIAYKPSAELLKRLRLPADKIKKFYHAPGETVSAAPDDEDEGNDYTGRAKKCAQCNSSGYFGRTGIFEVLLLTDEIREMIRSNPDLVAIKQVAAKNGLSTLFEDGVRKVVEGVTSLEEVNRVAK